MVEQTPASERPMGDRSGIPPLASGSAGAASVARSMREPGEGLGPLAHWLEQGDLGRLTLANLATALLYCSLGYAVSRFFAQYGMFPSPIWLPSSIAVVAAMVGGLRMFPGIFIGSLITNYMLFHPPLWEAAAISLGNALGPIAGAAALHQMRPAPGVFNRFRGVVAFIACNILLHPALTATGGTLTLFLAEGLDLAAASAIWVGWWLSDSGGTLWLAPALLLWLGVERESLHQKDVDWRDMLVWAGVAATVIVLFASIPLEGSIRWAFPFLLVLPLSWISLRMSLRAAYTLVSLVAVVAGAGTVAGYGPFQADGIGNPLQLVGVLIVLLALNVLSTVSLVAERREAEASSQAKSMFLATTSHDLRTPLTAIIGFSDLMRNEVLGPIGNNSYHGCVERIHESGKLLLDLINDVLDLSKIEAGRREIAPTMLDPHEVIESCIAIVEPRAAAKIITLDTDIEHPLPLYADGVALRQILLNLLSNAISYTPVGGRVAVRVSMAPDGGSMIEVSDTGVGMNEDGIKVALEPFGRVRRTTSSPQQEDGTGLGLPIAVLLTELHGGRLTIVSAPGQGTTVRVVLPMLNRP